MRARRHSGTPGTPDTPDSAADAMAGKTRFDDIYDLPDPRSYFRRLAPYEYEIPHHAQRVFRRTLAARRASAPPGPDGDRRNGVTVLDLCCSYGINAALLNHDLTLADLYAHYTGDETADLTTSELVDLDKEFYAARRRPDAVRMVGVDTAANATAYALAVGLLDEAYAENLERVPPSHGLARAMSGVGLITVTGGIGYVTHRTFDALLDCVRLPLWVSAFVLRTVPYDRIADTLAARGLVTGSDPARTYPQRLFTSPDEQRDAVERVRALGLDPTGFEAAGRYHTRLYESRPRPV
ncbi:methyltransferase type 12 [Streptomyces aureoverticillatus]|nr:methyltransferase type 12 [Streptomyces aureoverticillatus]